MLHFIFLSYVRVTLYFILLKLLGVLEDKVSTKTSHCPFNSQRQWDQNSLVQSEWVSGLAPPSERNKLSCITSSTQLTKPLEQKMKRLQTYLQMPLLKPFIHHVLDLFLHITVLLWLCNAKKRSTFFQMNTLYICVGSVCDCVCVVMLLCVAV